MIVGARAGIDAKAFEVHGAGRPVAGHVEDGIHQLPRTAAVDMGGSGLLELQPQVEGERRITPAVVELHLPLRLRLWIDFIKEAYGDPAYWQGSTSAPA